VGRVKLGEKKHFSAEWGGEELLTVSSNKCAFEKEAYESHV